ncbi:MAG: lipoprotein [Pseudomonadota bacterium]|nr:lipoprotein [Pseudomonadota bacterium]MED5441017.1 lipoprotein [Pseudomonadota bacterium]
MNLKTIAGVSLILLFAIGISACGQKGPLYLPDSEQEQEQ